MEHNCLYHSIISFSHSFCNKAIHHPTLQTVENAYYRKDAHLVLPGKQICCDPVHLKATSREHFSLLTLLSVLESPYRCSTWKDRCKIEGRQIQETLALLFHRKVTVNII